MSVLEKTIDVHGQGLKAARCDALKADHSSLPERKPQIEIDGGPARPN